MGAEFTGRMRDSCWVRGGCRGCRDQGRGDRFRRYSPIHIFGQGGPCHGRTALRPIWTASRRRRGRPTRRGGHGCRGGIWLCPGGCCSGLQRRAPSRLARSLCHAVDVYAALSRCQPQCMAQSKMRHGHVHVHGGSSCLRHSTASGCKVGHKAVASPACREWDRVPLKAFIATQLRQREVYKRCV